METLAHALRTTPTARGTPYTAQSIRVITGNIRRFARDAGVADPIGLLKDPEKLSAHLRSRGYSLNSLKSYFASAFTAARVLGLPTEKYKAALDRYSADVAERNLDAAYPEGKGDGPVPWPEILKVAASPTKNPTHRLIRELYTRMPPRRAEYRSVHAFPHMPEHVRTAKDKTAESKCDSLGVPWNFLDLSSGRLVLRDYKTSGHRGIFETIVPPEVLEAIKGPGPLFPGEITQQAFGAYVKRAFAPLDIGIRELRICRITYALEVERLPPRELKALADAMGHTVTTQGHYRRLGLLKPEEIRAKIAGLDPEAAMDILLAALDQMGAKINRMESKNR